MPEKKPPPKRRTTKKAGAVIVNINDATPKTPAPTTPARRGAGRRSRLTIDPTIEAAIVDAIKRGAFDYLAAEAAGVPAATFREWLARGEGRDPDRPATPEFAAFAATIAQARAEARTLAEARVYNEKPLEWLRMGPGRDRGPDAPGWTDRAELAVTGTMGPTELVITYVDDWRAGADPDQ